MIVDQLVSKATPPLKPTDTVEYALGLLMEVRVRHLPVVDAERRVLGILSEEQLLDANGPDVRLETMMSGRKPVAVSLRTHLFEVARLMMEHDLTTVPVVEDGLYAGLIRRHELFDWFAKTLGTHATGAILAVEVEERGYSLSQLVYAVEQNNVRILSLSTEQPEDSAANVRITIKLNVRDASRVKSVLEHHGYHVVAAFGEDEDDEDLVYRVQQFMRYLEV